MASHAEKIVPMPTRPEESWRRTDPELFFLPEGEILNAAGASASVPFSGWRIQSERLSKSEIEGNLSAVIGDFHLDFLDWIREGDLWNRLQLVFVKDGLARHIASQDSSSGEISLRVERFEPSTVIPGSEISMATAQRLAHSVGESIVVDVASHSNNDEPIVIVCMGGATASQSYASLKFVVASNARASLVVVEQPSLFAMRRHTVVLEEGARVAQLWLHHANSSFAKARVLSERVVHLNAHSQIWDAQIFSPQGTLRCLSNIVVKGEKAVAKSGVSVVAGGNSRFDYEPWQEHQVQKSRTELKAKYLVSGTAKAVFQGLIRVEREAGQTVALQENKNLLVGKRSRVDALPRLEILPDDVMCKHGSATGQLDARHVYYLTTRGFSEQEARDMIVRGFVRDGLGALPESHPLQGLADACLSRVLSSEIGCEDERF
jgi:Fe-S cluster assembly protein SufD